jgi:hypothetical protein
MEKNYTAQKEYRRKNIKSITLDFNLSGEEKERYEFWRDLPGKTKIIKDLMETYRKNCS